MIDLKEKEMSRGEFENVARALGGWEQLVNPAAKDKQTLALLDALVDWQKEDKLFENQQLFKTPIVRNGKKATVGYQPEIWKTWELIALSQKIRAPGFAPAGSLWYTESWYFPKRRPDLGDDNDMKTYMTPEEHARLHRRRGRQALGLLIAVLFLFGTLTVLHAGVIAVA